MVEYKGISRLSHPKWYGWSYIDTYHTLDRENYLDYLESDKPLQDLVKQHYNREKTFHILFNISIYIVFYIIAKSIGA